MSEIKEQKQYAVACERWEKFTGCATVTASSPAEAKRKVKLEASANGPAIWWECGAGTRAFKITSVEEIEGEERP